MVHALMCRLLFDIDFEHVSELEPSEIVLLFASLLVHALAVDLYSRWMVLEHLEANSP